MKTSTVKTAFFLLGLGIVSHIPAVVREATSEAGEPKSLNVLFVVFDDLGNVWDANRPIRFHTPNFDRLRESGVFFSRAYCQVPLCNPSRASLLTGKRPDATAVWDLDRHFRESLPEVKTLPQRFREQGYAVARVGKLFHYDVPSHIGTNGLDDPFSWDEVVNPRGRDVSDAAAIVNPTPEKPISAALSWLAADGTDEEQTDGLIATKAVEYLEAHRNRPFFLGVGFFRPHTPFVAPKSDFETYPISRVEIRRAPHAEWNRLLPAAVPHNIKQADYGLNDATLQLALQAYAASVTFVDRQLGRLLDAIDRLQLTDKTIVVACSDHGYHLGEHGLWQKRTLFDPSARAPLFIRAPGTIAVGRRCTKIVEFIDLAPTLLDWACNEASNDLDGRSLKTLLQNPDEAWPYAAFTQLLRPGPESPIMGRTVTTDRFRYVEWNEGNAGKELYDTSSDPNETINLADEPALQAVVRDLKALFEGKISGRTPVSPVNPARL